MLLSAAILTILIGLVHSYLGEKYILIRLFRQPLPVLFGDDTFTKQTLRFVWHLLTVAWFGLAALMILYYRGDSSISGPLNVIATTFALTALTAFVASRARHLSWIVFGAISVLCYVAASAAQV